MSIHVLNLDIKDFYDVKSGKKNFEIRNNDRGFEFGDILELKTYGADEEFLDTITATVLSVITDDAWNRDKTFTAPEIFEEKMSYKYGVRGVTKVLKEYFFNEGIPDGYVLIKIKVVE